MAHDAFFSGMSEVDKENIMTKKKATPEQLDEMRRLGLDKRPEFQDRENDLPQLGEAPSWQSRGPRHQQYSSQSRDYQDHGKKAKKNEQR
jgi:hypothetical protein